MRYKKYFPKFVKAVRKRMNKGYREYGDGSFDRYPLELLDEIQQELEDVAGWACIMWGKLEELEKKYIMKKLEEK